mmetsp:Transcript_9225/g.30660  ORF Transcript_9225/g.30660 Transcript_9225/m.30660 type:complete len:241 (+) Transcript_9225:89-811(+)
MQLAASIQAHAPLIFSHPRHSLPRVPDTQLCSGAGLARHTPCPPVRLSPTSADYAGGTGHSARGGSSHHFSSSAAIQFGRSSATSVPSRRKRRSLPPKLLTHSRTRSALSAKMPYCRPCAISVQGRRGRAGDHRASSVPCRSRVSGRRIWRHRWRSRRWRRYTSCMRRFCSSEKRLPERRLREPDAAALSRSTESWVRSTRGRRSEVASEAITSAEGAPPSSRRRGGVGSSAGRPHCGHC